ncbi:F-actin-monooxygenase MICAL3-like isoform X2 [Anarrhichthys ocellatus]|uniref:F-actin-monooxygenase MICAL3-like isoform X2 n=1 Tax=Anarrhichthys ocellatus TaxID=433405 RepID=UPI0012ED5772|nr:F-actin-monooxygenase MICAL3-like isoform X2 [Anarrhichthys ocellatus]XP_031698291.1 F-actin-monooxygenase MICAL3-like isoform X2 [Anarrhichthys ocellatus]
MTFKRSHICPDVSSSAVSGRFYCLQHYDSRLRNKPTSHRASIASLGSESLISASGRRSSVVSVMVATMPERIELENYRRSSTKMETEELLEEPEEPEEVSEETLNRFNLGMDEKDHHRSSSESEMEEEEEGRGHRHRVTSEEAKASWRETLQQHLHLREEEEEYEEEDEEEEVESSDGESQGVFLFPVMNLCMLCCCSVMLCFLLLVELCCDVLLL